MIDLVKTLKKENKDFPRIKNLNCNCNEQRDRIRNSLMFSEMSLKDN